MLLLLWLFLLLLLLFITQLMITRRMTMKDKIEGDKPRHVSLQLDGWTAFLTGYVGANVGKQSCYVFLSNIQLNPTYSNLT